MVINYRLKYYACCTHLYPSCPSRLYLSLTESTQSPSSSSATFISWNFITILVPSGPWVFGDGQMSINASKKKHIKALLNFIPNIIIHNILIISILLLILLIKELTLINQLHMKSLPLSPEIVAVRCESDSSMTPPQLSEILDNQIICRFSDTK